MTTRKVLGSVLRGFLDTYASRNSDCRGYWLLPTILLGRSVRVIDLLEDAPHADQVAAFAVRRFEEQACRQRLDRSAVKQATLTISVSPETAVGRHGDFQSEGRLVQLRAEAASCTGRAYRHERSVFLAPHDPAKERRRLPASWEA